MRLFVGVPLPDDIRQRLAMITGGVPGARWARPENLHLTLRFLGETDNARAEDIVSELSRIDCEAFAAVVRGLGAFGDRKRPRILWAGIPPSPPLTRLHQKVEQALQRAGCGPDHRKFHPHVTLARLKDVQKVKLERFMTANGHVESRPFTVGGFTLFESFLASEGAHYRAIAEFELAGGEEVPA